MQACVYLCFLLFSLPLFRSDSIVNFLQSRDKETLATTHEYSGSSSAAGHNVQSIESKDVLYRRRGGKIEEEKKGGYDKEGKKNKNGQD